MSDKIFDQTICLKQYISEKEFKEINQLEALCKLQDKTNLKLELDYRLNRSRNAGIGLEDINEFLYYVEDIPVAYISISSFGGSNIGEINGMTHPDFRRKGLFKKLFKLVIEECQKRSFNKLLLLSDANSRSGIEFIKAVGGEYDFSEFRMKRISQAALDGANPVRLRAAGKLDGKEIVRQNAIFFNHSEDCEAFAEEEEELNNITYMVELKERVIGKIKVECNANSAFISGFGILPEFRGKGYGKAAMEAALCLISEKNINETELDVECKNNTALNLYKACGFEEQSEMCYYKYNI